MVKIAFSKCDKGYYFMNIALHSNMKFMKDLIVGDKVKKKKGKDWDMVICVDGREGAGKSVLAQQMAYFLNPNFNLDNLCFNSLEFRKKILAANKFDAIIYDEAFSGLNARQSMGAINRSVVSMLTEIRQKNLFVFILVPSFFDLDKYVALWRSFALIHVYTGKNLKRGFFSFYNYKRKKKLYLLGKKLYQYNKEIPNFRGEYPNQYTVNEKEYREKKMKKLGIEEKKLEIASKYKLQRDTLLLWMYKKKQLKLSYRLIGEILGLVGDGLTGRAVATAVNELQKQIMEKEQLKRDMIEIKVDEHEEAKEFPEY